MTLHIQEGVIQDDVHDEEIVGTPSSRRSGYHALQTNDGCATSKAGPPPAIEKIIPMIATTSPRRTINIPNSLFTKKNLPMINSDMQSVEHHS
eukprot:CAMPEP_0201638134 /NCGR_PEP_ID=MMETSP0493-20130528/15670_1 /ASSEMBLY_ACC=CAM_ASM_000838 /TAXON_ID=420259 /ORGANISM="Thalassiosira gravida, Strain GMp14c1" /LENGTH=92 /DNA_ID=CAMNT_0048111057 /DNA_START=233 /DNA_END=511 /DNA_ORIENTATION=+